MTLHLNTRSCSLYKMNDIKCRRNSVGKLIIQGGNRLEGRVYVLVVLKMQYSLLFGTLLASTPSKLLEIPNLEDVGMILPSYRVFWG